MFDTGGYAADSTARGQSFGKYKFQYDLQSQLQLNDLEKNGLKAHLYRIDGDAGGTGVGAVQSFEENYQPGDSDVKQYLANADDVRLASGDPKNGSRVVTASEVGE